ncbi:AGE family epimerase/isomerase [Aetokthonos hydrillicola Thurmond2011]|jgi:anti-anti-sigma factor|uniref:AGE family epimerase/isomerase n=2 Tax=Aetokthonos TaxID=1550243 RepID=A0AAP5M8Q9_9CYAN|nr:AGE family epimerase/isomerase [Aetokthonos hydrillicola]MBO3459385.1 STAS domain-containing protein [Aetokthonos hydrillicola CCALA 1050]MBW4586531.1 AGE family epimerase/isomerase [Aetokthonos hydrillicola CCALA 1050]MDR9893524.1 AGE family epimerase/isomerase [Aetokthonos hydrillicola Thurmond2011]
MNKLGFPFSDLIAGYVVDFDPKKGDFGTFTLKTSDSREFEVALTSMTYAELLRNLDEPYFDCTGQISSMLVPNRYLFAYGIFYPEADKYNFEAKHIVFLGRKENEYLFEKQDWWLKQIRSLANFYLKAQFEDGEIDYRKYRTGLGLVGSKEDSSRQETDTISRLVYGFATAYMMTGDDRYLEAAEKGTEYLRDHMRFLDEGEGICYWYHAVDVKPDGSEQKIFSSEFGDDYDAIPAYEQIYALAGPTQTYRVTGDPGILNDIDLTINLFNRYFLDKSDFGGFFSHIDPITLSAHAESLGHNRAKKNWNSVGDHAPAYLINLWLATGEEKHAKFLEYTFDTIEKRFPDYEHSPFVQERFYEDWSHDTTWGWQQNRAVVGHNLKIAWNLMRMNNLKPKEKYVALAEKIAEIMPAVGSDQQRGGWLDVVERILKPGQEVHRFVWHNRKAWWQQEQAILAYLILNGSLDKADYQRLAREASAFYNAWFLDYAGGGVYFNVLASGLPYLLGTERGKGSHSMSGYHSFELAYLACVYTNLLITKQPMDLYFKPKPGGFKDNILQVAPDILPPGSVKISDVWINGQKYTNFDPTNLTVKLPSTQDDLKVRVRLLPTQVSFDATLLEVANGIAKISLRGLLDASAVEHFQDVLIKATEKPIKRLVLFLEDLECITTAGLRSLIFTKQKLGSGVDIYIVGAQENVKQFLKTSAFCDGVIVLDEYESVEAVTV